MHARVHTTALFCLATAAAAAERTLIEGDVTSGVLLGCGSNRFVKDVGPATESNEQAGESDSVFV